MAKKKNKNVSKKLANKLAKIAVKQIETSVRFKQPRMDSIKLNEDLYHGKPMPRLTGRFSIPLPTMSGFVDTLMSKIDEEPTIAYSSDDIADQKKVRVTSAVAARELKRRELRFKQKDRGMKKLACFSGVGIGEFFAESDPSYKNHFTVIDHYDFQCEPLGGGYLENHEFCGRMNLFKTEHDIEQLVESEWYNGDQFTKLKEKTSQSDKKRNVELFKNKINRFMLMGLNPENYDYSGQTVYPLVWWGMVYKGERYLLVLDYTTGVWLRCEKLLKDFESGLWPWSSWQTHEDEFVFWSKAPADDIRPVAIAIDIIFNQALDNRQKRNFGQRAYDPNIFPNPEELEWRPDGLVRASTNNGVKAIGNGIYEFNTPEISGTIDMIQFMDSYSGKKTGINDSAQGESDDKKVGIFFGQLQQVADRLGLYNKSYSDFHEEIGLRLLHGMKEHLDDEDSVKIIGAKGVETEQILRSEIDTGWDVVVSGGQAEFRANEVKKQKREQTIEKILSHQGLSERINPEFVITELLEGAEYDQDAVARALDVSGLVDTDLLAEAETAIQEILAGKEPETNRGATTSFIDHIISYATKTRFHKDAEEDMQIFKTIVAYAEKHLPIAEENAIRKARRLKTQNLIAQRLGKGDVPSDGGNIVQEGAEFGIADEPPANTRAGVQKQVKEIEGAITP